MSLLTRVIRLESRIRTPVNPVHVVFHRDDRVDERVLKSTRAESQDSKSTVIVVKFVEPSKPV